MKTQPKDLDDINLKRLLLGASFQGVKILFVLGFANTEIGDKKVERNSYRKYFLSRVNVTKYNVLIDARNFQDQAIGDQIKKHDEVRKVVTGEGDDYTTRGLLDYQCFKDLYRLIAVNLKKQKELDADPRAIQQNEFYGMLDTNSKLCTI